MSLRLRNLRAFVPLWEEGGATKILYTGRVSEALGPGLIELSWGMAITENGLYCSLFICQELFQAPVLTNEINTYTLYLRKLRHRELRDRFKAGQLASVEAGFGPRQCSPRACASHLDEIHFISAESL